MMGEEPPIQENPDPLAAIAANATETLEKALAMLLLSRQVRVRNFSMSEDGLAQVELGGRAIETGLGALAQVMSITPPKRKRHKVKEEDEERPPRRQESFWQALKDFALPPMSKQ